MIEPTNKKKKPSPLPKSLVPSPAFMEVQEALKSSPRYNKKTGFLAHRVTGTRTIKWI